MHLDPYELKGLNSLKRLDGTKPIIGFPCDPVQENGQILPLNVVSLNFRLM